jgi:imidazolonepropionase-like amidohydrolase
MKQVLTYISVLFFLGNLFSQKTPTHIALINGIAHIGNGALIDNCLLVIKDDKIETVTDAKGIKLNYKSYDTVIDLNGKHIYPGFINANNILGLHDAEAVRATADYREVGQLNPHVRALIAYNTDNIIVPTVRSNGILYTQVTPRGGLISGSSAIMALDGWNWEDAVLLTDDGIHLNFPPMVIQRWSADEGEIKAANNRYKEEMQFLTKFFEDAAAYCKQAFYDEKDLRFEAMRSVLNGKANLYVHTQKAKDMLSAINFSKKFSIQKMVIVGGREAFKITTELKRAKIPVMLDRMHDLPDNTDDDVDIVFSTPYLLLKDSVLFCIQQSGGMEAMQSRNLPYNAGQTVAYGLTKEQALASITSNVAKILGIDKWIGTLEEGKLASLIVSEGDVLDMRTSNILLAFIAGKKVELNNKQSDLYLKYKNKYGIK